MQRTERLEAGDEIEHHQQQEKEMIDRPAPADGPQKTGIEALHHQRPIDDGERQERHGSDRADLVEGRGVDGEDGPEEDMQQIDVEPRSETMSTPSASDVR